MSSDQEEDHEGNLSSNSSSVNQANEGDTSFFGPALPPQLLKKPISQAQECRKVYGPVLPSDISKKEKLESDDITLSTSELRDKRLIGPELPEHLISTEATASDADEEANSSYGDVENNFDVGPSTNLMATGDVANYHKFENAGRVIKQDTGETSTKRESWMTELPEKKAASFGLFPRQFRSKIPTEKECDSSVWTDTPSDKEKKQNQKDKNDHKEILKIKRLQERDKEMEKLAKKATKKLKKKESLLEIHMRKMKKKKKKEAKKREKDGVKKVERRPFDRNIDLQIRKFDESHKRAILNKNKTQSAVISTGSSPTNHKLRERLPEKTPSLVQEEVRNTFPQGKV